MRQTPRGLLVMGFLFCASGLIWIQEAHSAPKKASKKAAAPAPVSTPAPSESPAESISSAASDAGTPGKSAALGVQGLYLDVTGAGGYSSVSGEDLVAPTLASWGAGITAGWELFNNIVVGISSDFRFINQHSRSSDGNYRGKRWNIASPTVGYRSGKLFLKGDFQILGAHKLDTLMEDDETSIEFAKPLGGRIVALWSIAPHLAAGIQGEFITFKKMNLSNGDVIDLTPAYKIWQGGLALAYQF